MEASTLLSLLGSVVTIAIASVGVAFMYGRLDSRMESLGETVENGFAELKLSRDKAHERLGKVENKVVRLESNVFREITRPYTIRESGTYGDE